MVANASVKEKTYFVKMAGRGKFKPETFKKYLLTSLRELADKAFVKESEIEKIKQEALNEGWKWEEEESKLYYEDDEGYFEFRFREVGRSWDEVVDTMARWLLERKDKFFKVYFKEQIDTWWWYDDLIEEYIEPEEGEDEEDKYDKYRSWDGETDCEKVVRDVFFKEVKEGVYKLRELSYEQLIERLDRVLTFMLGGLPGVYIDKPLYEGCYERDGSYPFRKNDEGIDEFCWKLYTDDDKLYLSIEYDLDKTPYETYFKVKVVKE